MLRPVLIDMPNGRVGSTLLMKLLGSSDHIAFDRLYPFESRFICHSLQASVLPFQTRVAPLDELARDSFTALWSAYAARLSSAFPGAQYYAEKLLTGMPLSIINSTELRPKYIELVRDPRDILVSIRAFNAKRGVQGFGRGAWKTEAEYFAWYLTSMDEQLARLGTSSPEDTSRILVRYEDLAEDLAGVANKLGDWLGLDLSSAPEYVLSDALTYGTHATTSSVQHSVGRWKTELSPMDAREIRDRLGPHLERFGYDT